MDFIFMLTRNDRTIDDAAHLVDAACELGVRHIGFKDIGVPFATMRDVADRIRRRGGISYLEVVSTTSEAVARSLETARALGVDRILGGTDLHAAMRSSEVSTRYFPFAGKPVGHPTRLEGSADVVAEHCRAARAAGCAGVDLLAYRATEANPLDLVRAARTALTGKTLIVAGSVNSTERIHALAAAGADAFTIGSAVFDGAFSPSKGSFREQILDILEACDTRRRWPREQQGNSSAIAMNAAPDSADAIEQLLRATIPTPTAAAPIAIPVRSIVIENTLRGVEADVVRPLALGQRLAVVSDPATYEALGRRVRSALSAIATIVPVRLQFVRTRIARTVAAVREACESVDALVAVGSGTINDLCKYAAAQDGKPYVVFATAPSMNGYTSMNAAITVDGHKRSLAPGRLWRLHRSRSVSPRRRPNDSRRSRRFALPADRAGDWLLSHHLLGTPYRSAPFVDAGAGRAEAFDAPEALMAGDLDAMRRSPARSCCPARHDHLRRQLSLRARESTSSATASTCARRPIAATTFTVSRWRWHADHGEDPAADACRRPPMLDARRHRGDLAHRFGAQLGASCWHEFLPKRAVAQAAATLSRRATDCWSDLNDALGRCRCSRASLRIMTRAEGPTTRRTSVSPPRCTRAPSATRVSCATGTRSSISPTIPAVSRAGGPASGAVLIA
jgi:phosphoribosylformimino-5-aminoimidazole carboxamide ribonucleotide (ProFAR) isomerase